MGIVNVTPDSFSDGGAFLDSESALRHALKLISQGADLIDLGGESTRPGAEPVSEFEELSRLIPVLRRLRQETQIPISIDTTKSTVAGVCLSEGADVINDVSGLRTDPAVADRISEFGAGLILMHRRGTPQTMQSLADYQDVIAEVIDELNSSFEEAEKRGVLREQIVVDPGIGFAKTAGQSFELIARLSEFKGFGRPILIGPSRKSFIGSVIHREPKDRLAGTIAACLAAYERGAGIFRVHEVKEVKEALMMAEAIVNSGKKVAL